MGASGLTKVNAARVTMGPASQARSAKRLARLRPGFTEPVADLTADIVHVAQFQVMRVPPLHRLDDFLPPRRSVPASLRHVQHEASGIPARRYLPGTHAKALFRRKAIWLFVARISACPISSTVSRNAMKIRRESARPEKKSSTSSWIR